MLSLSRTDERIKINTGSQSRKKSHLEDFQLKRFPSMLNMSESTPMVRKVVKAAIQTIEDFNDKKQINSAIFNLNTIQNRKSILNHIIKSKKKQNLKDEQKKMSKLSSTLQKIKGRFLQLLPYRNSKGEEAVMDSDYFLKYNLTQKKKKEPYKKDLVGLLMQSIRQYPTSEPVSLHISATQDISQSQKQIENRCLNESGLKQVQERQDYINLRQSITMKPYEAQQRKDSTQAIIIRAKSRMETGVYSPRKISSKVLKKPSQVLFKKKTLQHLTILKVDVEDNKPKNISPRSIQERVQEGKSLKIKQTQKQITKINNIIEGFHQKKEMNETFQAINKQQQEDEAELQSSKDHFFWFTNQIKQHINKQKCTREYRHAQLAAETEEKKRTLLFCKQKIFVNKSEHVSQKDGKISRHKEFCKVYDDNQEEDDQSFISYTETKLDGIYSSTIQLQKDIKKLNRTNQRGSRVQIDVQDQIDQKNSNLQHNNKESMRLLYRKQSQ